MLWKLPKGCTWLNNEIELYHSQDETDDDLCLPRKPDGSFYELEDLKMYGDQYKTVLDIMSYLKRWYEDDTGSVAREPVRYMMVGSAGSGKSTVINTLITAVRRMFGYKNAIQVFAPTGGAAAAANGKTIHNGLQISVFRKLNSKDGLSDTQRKKLMKSLLHTVVAVFDEFSMISGMTMNQAKFNCQIAAHNGNNPNVPWGGIPIIILSGDGMQLPSIAPGICNMPVPGCSRINKPETTAGLNEFMQFQDHVSVLTTGKRQCKGQEDFQNLLELARTDKLGQNEVRRLKRLTVSEAKLHHSESEWAVITNEAVYLYAKNIDVDHKNSERLEEMSGKDNPVAKIHSKSFRKTDKRRKSIAKHFSGNDFSTRTTLLCKGAIVEIAGRNFMPEWGLYNHSDGRIVDIVFAKDMNPNNGDLPEYVVVDINDYCGPVWDPANPKHVPIPVMIVHCNHHCCERHFFALRLAFARTIHSFQGKSAGPTDEGKPDNAIQYLIIDVGDRFFETRTPGLFYVGFSRGTTIGDEKRKRFSCIF